LGVEATERMLEFRDILSYQHVPNGRICIRSARQFEQEFCSLYTRLTPFVT